LILLARSDGFEPPTLRFEVGGAPAQYLLVHRRDADDLTEEVHHLLGPRKTAEITVNDNSIEAKRLPNTWTSVLETQGQIDNFYAINIPILHSGSACTSTFCARGDTTSRPRNCRTGIACIGLWRRRSRSSLRLYDRQTETPGCYPGAPMTNGVSYGGEP